MVSSCAICVLHALSSRLRKSILAASGLTTGCFCFALLLCVGCCEPDAEKQKGVAAGLSNNTEEEDGGGAVGGDVATVGGADLSGDYQAKSNQPKHIEQTNLQ